MITPFWNMWDPTPLLKKNPKESQFFSDKEILDWARPPCPPFGVFLKKKTVYFFWCLPLESGVQPGPLKWLPRLPWEGAHSCMRGRIWLVSYALLSWIRTKSGILDLSGPTEYCGWEVLTENPSPKNYNFWQPVATFVSLWQLWATWGNFWQFVATSGTKGREGEGGQWGDKSRRPSW